MTPVIINTTELQEIKVPNKNILWNKKNQLQSELKGPMILC